MSARTLRRRAALLSVAIVVAACSSGGSPTPASVTPSVAPSTAVSPSIAAASPAGPVTLPTPEKTAIKMGLSGSWTAGIMSAAIADYLDLGKKFGLNIEYTNFSGGSQVVQALIAGQVDVSDNSSGPVVASLATDSPLIITFVSRSNLTDIMYSAANVKTAADLRGKSVAISSFGSQSHAGALLALKSLGLSPSDVTIMQVGNDSARLAALQGGSVAASMNDATQADKLTGLGFNELVKLEDVKDLGGVARTSLTATQAFADANPNTMLALTAMEYEALLMWRANPDLAAEALASLEKVDLASATKELADSLAQPWVPLDGRCDPAVMEFTKQTLIPTNADLATVDASKACTNKFLDQLDALGWKPNPTAP